MKKIFISLIICLSVTACATKPLTAEEKAKREKALKEGTQIHDTILKHTNLQGPALYPMFF